MDKTFPLPLCIPVKAQEALLQYHFDEYGYQLGNQWRETLTEIEPNIESAEGIESLEEIDKLIRIPTKWKSPPK